MIKCNRKELIAVPNIKPISDLRNYSDVLKEVDELDRLKAAYTLFANLQRAEERAQKEGWIESEDLEKELGVSQD